MDFHRTGRLAMLALAFAAAPVAASAYVGPGAGLTAIGTALALIGALVLAVVGFVWYPVKRLLGRRSAAPPLAGPQTAADRSGQSQELGR